MEKATFMGLCSELKRQNFLDDLKGVHVKEALMMFLLIVGHKQGIRLIRIVSNTLWRWCVFISSGSCGGFIGWGNKL